MIAAIVFLNLVNLALLVMVALSVFDILIQPSVWVILVACASIAITKAVNVKVLKHADSIQQRK